MPHVRADNDRPRALIERASAASPTFRQLVDRLDGSSVVVYVQFGICPQHVDACLAFGGMAPPFTYLRATLDRFSGSEAVLAGLIAHELRHACEVADAGVTTLVGFRQFYTEHGRHEPAGFETDAAAATGRAVEQELSGRPPRRFERQ